MDQIWIRDGWADRLGIPGDDTGLGWSADQVTGLPRHEASLFLEYMKSIETSTFEYLDGVGSKDFDFVPDRSTFPEFEAAAKFFEGYTIGQGFRQLLGEKTTHMGHVTFLRGLQRGINK